MRTLSEPWPNERADLAHARTSVPTVTRNLASLAASYAFGIARNHPFVDGNKRVASAAFLLNRITFRVDPAHATASVLALAAGEIDEAGFARWVRDNLPCS